MGIAARQLKSDVIFIVVLGGRPNALPALADPEEGKLYLTTERNTWQGNWMGEATSYRLLDADHQPFQDWQDWALILDLPQKVQGDRFYVEYRDAKKHRTEAEVSLKPVVWTKPAASAVQVADNQSQPAAASSTPAQSSANLPVFATNTPARGVGNLPAFVTNTPVSAGGNPPVFATNTPAQPITTLVAAVNTPLPRASATPAPAVGSDEQAVMLDYDKGIFTLIPMGKSVNLGRINFRNGSLAFRATKWEAVNSQINISALRNKQCLQIQVTNGNFNAPGECGFVVSVINLAESQLFWTSGSFEVLLDDQVITTCPADAKRCPVKLPS
jgi:hypothetical protein